MGTFGDWINALIDNLLAFSDRLLDLPLFMLLGLAGTLAAALFFLLPRLRRRWRKRLITALWILAFFGVIILNDRKTLRLQNQLNDLRLRSVSDAAAAAAAQPAPSPATSVRQNFLFDLAQARLALPPLFPQISLRPQIYDSATDVVNIYIPSPLIHAYLAVIDLTRPDLTIHVGGSLQSKSLTSAFAKENHCTIAINGEAGVSPAADANLPPCLPPLLLGPSSPSHSPSLSSTLPPDLADYKWTAAHSDCRVKTGRDGAGAGLGHRPFFPPPPSRRPVVLPPQLPPSTELITTADVIVVIIADCPIGGPCPLDPNEPGSNCGTMPRVCDWRWADRSRSE